MESRNYYQNSKPDDWTNSQQSYKEPTVEQLKDDSELERMAYKLNEQQSSEPDNRGFQRPSQQTFGGYPIPPAKRSYYNGFINPYNPYIYNGKKWNSQLQLEVWSSLQ